MAQKSLRLYTNFIGGIDGNTSKAFIDALKRETNKKNISEIYISMSSEGGMTRYAFTIYSFLKSLKDSGIKIITHNIGMVASAALIIFLVGNERYSNENSTFTIHGTRIQTSEALNAIKLKDMVDIVDLEDITIQELFEQTTKLDKNRFNKMIERDSLVKPALAKELEMIDDIRESPSPIEFQRVV